LIKDKTDREDFIERLASLLQETFTLGYAPVFMTNHVYVLLRTGSVPISSIMRRLLTDYAVRFIPAFSGNTAGADIFYRNSTI
jgi:hypothetical protein